MPAVGNDVVFIGTTLPRVYAFSVDTGVALWTASGLGPPAPVNYILVPAISGDVVVLGHANGRNGAVHIYSL